MNLSYFAVYSKGGSYIVAADLQLTFNFIKKKIKKYKNEFETIFFFVQQL